MPHQLKSISKAGIPEAIAKAELYRYLNEPEEAESICRDILVVDADHQLARRMLGLAITDQFTRSPSSATLLRPALPPPAPAPPQPHRTPGHRQ